MAEFWRWKPGNCVINVDGLNLNKPVGAAFDETIVSRRSVRNGYSCRVPPPPPPPVPFPFEIKNTRPFEFALAFAFVAGLIKARILSCDEFKSLLTTETCELRIPLADPLNDLFNVSLWITSLIAGATLKSYKIIILAWIQQKFNEYSKSFIT